MIYKLEFYTQPNYQIKCKSTVRSAHLQGLKKLTSHALFSRKLLEDLLHQERGRLDI